MEFFNDIGADPLKPSLFELVAQEQLRDLLQPALKYVLAVFAQRYPRYLLRIVNSHEEFYAFIMLLVERHYLQRHGASFSENFYGLKRRRRPYIEPERAKAATGGILEAEKLGSREIRRSLIFLVGLPYLRAKAQDYYEELGGGASSDIIEEGMGTRQLSALTEQSFKGWLRRSFKAIYPWLNTSFEVWLLVCNIAYLFDQTPFYRPWLSWIGVDLRRLGLEDYRAASLAARARIPRPEPRSILAQIRRLISSSPRLLLDSLRLLLPTAIFFIKFLEWWYSPNSPARSLSVSPLGPAVPPPSLLPPHPKGIGFDPRTYGICPLCHKEINNATSMPSGYVFCYRCAYDHVEKHGECPVTLLPAKFGKHIQSHQVPGWSPYYLDYKFLKKIISSLEAKRPASESAALALGTRPGDILTQPVSATTISASRDATPGVPPIFSASDHDEDRGPEFQAHKAAFFFKLERELEKINAFYLQKEAELKLRLETLLSKRRAAAMRGLPDTADGTIQNHVEWNAVEEGFRLLERDLGKLQGFVEINATGFRKILKKFDKRSKSTTKELYLSRQVDVQPVFNRELLSELSDTVASCLLNLTDLSSDTKFEGRAAHDIFTQQILTERVFVGPLHDLEKNLRKAVASADQSAIVDCVHYSEVLVGDERRNTTRILWSVIVEAPPDLADLILSSLSSPFDFDYVDDINGRTCLHEAAIAGALRLVRLCIDKHVPVDKVDAYGRNALHYAAMNGHSTVCQSLLETNVSLNRLDIDNYNPLVYATLRGSVDCVKVLLDHGDASPQPTTPNGDLIPLSLASQSGHVDVVQLLLEHGAECIANSNGEYPIHLAARAGHVDVCKLLINHVGWDVPDKYHEWTPLFHAARYGNDECVRVLIGAGARVNIVDELGHRAVHYAAWYGHYQSLSYLLEASSRVPVVPESTRVTERSPGSDDPMSVESEIDLIPSLSLPPPIMPHRVYGHNYLDRSHLVQVSLGHSTGKHKDFSGVRLHHRLISPAFRDEYLLTTAPLKLVMTTAPQVTSAPYSISLPPRDEKGVFIFQTPSLDSLSLEFSVYPSFGTKTIGCAVALPSLFTGIENNQAFTLPILDQRLHVVGEVSFEINIISSFDGVTLEVGGDVETYWKSTGMSIIPHSLSPWPQRSNLIGSAQTSPSTHSLSTNSSQASTISSLRGKFLTVVIQVTRDLQPVVYTDWLLPDPDFDLSVCDVTLEQFESLARRSGKNLISESSLSSSSNWPTLVSEAMISLVQLLKILPSNIGLCLEVVYPSRAIREELNLSRRLDLNQVVDSVLRTIYHGHSPQDNRNNRRRIMFTSFSPDICAALNWKQPNYAVFLASHCGRKVNRIPRPIVIDSGDTQDRRLTSLGATVEFARMNNLLGVFIDATLLIQVPSLIHSVRNAGLLVGITETAEEPLNGHSEGVDAFLREGVITFTNPSI
ncbi:cyclin-dependent protein kinase inhibitor [Lentinula raphanica]|uniref:Peroxisome assembly protein 12 n=1 Tax=Lentinula raphanica TaxID=153919 RepID=A0AA38PH09_9AGAR|nr:cyclin-dependent protein kinase inhibitor [Lentinula raphanica]KAJ3977550.1 cyclin-dependent protein kinase inhibitor [Lentinula raphanica]